MITIASYGGGVNSTAMLVNMAINHVDPPYAILFADTGAELPYTYWYIDYFSQWLKSQKYPGVTVVKSSGKTLEQDCLDRNALPSIAYGFKTCSQRWKLQPQDKFCNNDTVIREEWKNGRKITKLIGYDAGEKRRAKDYDDNKYEVRYPLIECGIDRDKCISIIEECQLKMPGKSSCFFCPNMGKDEIRELSKSNPDLIDRALVMEKNADLTYIKGLGRTRSWRELISQGDLFDGFWCSKDNPCGCYD